MWKKPFKTRETILKTPDRKRLKDAVLKVYPSLEVDALDQLIPNKGQTVCSLKVTGTYTIIYTVNGEPVFYDVDSRNTIYPTGTASPVQIRFRNLLRLFYALWKLPPFMYQISIHDATFQFLAKGADLMLPGIVLPENGLKLVENTKAVVVLHDSGIAVAVGSVALSKEINQRTDLSGKAVVISHFLTDLLWAFGSKTVPSMPQSSISADSVSSMVQNGEVDEAQKLGLERAQSQLMDSTSPIPTDQTIVKSEEISTSTLQQTEADSPAENPSSIPHHDDANEDTSESTSTVTVEEMDTLILNAFLQAIKKKLKEKQLPILVSTFWSDYCLPCRRVGTDINIKRSSWKKINLFLDEMEQKGVITLQTNPNGISKIVSVSRGNSLYFNYKPVPISETMESELKESHQATEEAEQDGKPKIESFWRLHNKLKFLLTETEGEDLDDKVDSESSQTHEVPSSSSSSASSSNAPESIQNDTSADASTATSLLEQLQIRQVYKAASRSRNRDVKNYTSAEAASLLWNYVTQNHLDQSGSSKVQLDSNLCKALFSSTHKIGDFVEKQELSKAYKAKLVPIQVVTVNGEQIIESGAQIGNIHIIVENRGGSKVVSRVQGLHHFGIEVKVFSKSASKKFASTSGTASDHSGNEEVILQGNLAKLLPPFLSSEFNIPQKYIKVDVKSNVRK